MTSFQTVKKPDQFIIDLRTDEEKELCRKNQPMQTYKLKPEIYEERAQLNSQSITSFVCNPSFYNLSDVDPSQNLQIAGGKEGKTINTYTVDFKFF